MRVPVRSTLCLGIWAVGVQFLMAQTGILQLTPGVISTYAGGGAGTCQGATDSSGDGCSALNAKFAGPRALAIDSAGNLYIMDTSNHVVRKLTASSGVVTRYAGNGTAGYAGDGGAATSGELNSNISSIAMDRNNNLYIADGLNIRIRVVTPGGILNTFAGTGANGCAGDGGQASAALLGGTSGTYLTGVATDANGNVYISDTYNNKVREVSATGIINTIAGTCTTGSNNLAGDGGPALSATFYSPRGLAVDSSGNVYIDDAGHNRIRVVSTTGLITEVAGGGTSTTATSGIATSALDLNSPRTVTVDAGNNLYIADQNNNRVVKVDPFGNFVVLAGSAAAGAAYTGDGGNANAATLNGPYWVMNDGTGNILIADTSNNVIRRVNTTTSIMAFGSVVPNTTSSPQSVTISNAGSGPLTLTSIYVPAPFATAPSNATTDCLTITSLARGASCELSVVYSPTTQAAATATAVILSNSGGGTNVESTVQLSGTGQPLTPTVTLTTNASGNAITVSQPITFTTSISAPSGANSVPTGTVNFYEGSILLGTSTVTNGMATFAVAAGALSPGSDPISAVYSGNPAFTSATSPLVIVSVTNPNAPYTLTVTTNSASRQYGTPNPALSGTYSGAQNGDMFTVNFITVAGITSPPGTYTIAPVVQGTNLLNYNVVSHSGVLTVTQANTAVGVSISNSLPAQGTNVQFSISVTSASAGTPTGTVALYEGSTLLSTLKLVSGAASYSSAGLPLGTSTISAVYSGDSNFLGSTSASQPFSVGTPGVTIVPASGTLTVMRGGTATIGVTVSSTYGFIGTESFACGNASVYLTCTFSPASIALSAYQSVPLTLTITASNVNPPMASLRSDHDGLVKYTSTAFASLLIVSLGVSRRRRGLRGLLVLVGAVVLTAGVIGCQTGTSSAPPGTYAVQLSANGSALASSTLTVTVQ